MCKDNGETNTYMKHKNSGKQNQALWSIFQFVTGTKHDVIDTSVQGCGKEEKRKDPLSSGVKCYFVRMESNWVVDNESYMFPGKFVHEARTVFMHIHTVSNLFKYMVRMMMEPLSMMKIENQ